MNTLTLNNISLDGGNVIIKKGNNTGGSSSSGGGNTAPVSKNDVTFYDYDGTILHSYTKDEFLALSAMPELPTRKGLICQEWNWSFGDAIAYVSEYGILDVGATYITDDGKTRLYIRIATKGRMDVPLYFSQTVANGVTIDWGDGSETQTLSGTGNVNVKHKYAVIGDYVITLDPVDECDLVFGHNSESYSIMGSISEAYCNVLQKVEVGKNIKSIGYNAFRNCYSLALIGIPNNIQSMPQTLFYDCRTLRHITCPNGITNLSQYMCNNCYSLSSISIPKSVASFSKCFSNCYSLKTIVIPDNVTSIFGGVFSSLSALSYMIIPNRVKSIGSSAFSYCYSLTSIVIPNSVTSIANSAFMDCRAIAFCDFSKHTIVPTLSATDVFQNTASDFKIIVPDALYDEWIAATNWSTYASKIIKKSDWDASQA